MNANKSFLFFCLIMAVNNIVNISAAETTSEDPYGNAQTEEFQKAVGKIDNETTAKERYELSRIIPIKHENKFYLTLGINNSTVFVKSFRNITSSDVDPIFANVTVNVNPNHATSHKYEFAIGYLWKKARIEFEWLKVGRIGVDGTIASNPNELTALYSSRGIIGTYSYDIIELFRAKLYASGILGLGRNKAILTLRDTDNNVAATPKKVTTNSIIFGIGAGARFNLFSKLYLDFGGRYLFLGDSTAKNELNVPDVTAGSLALRSKKFQSSFGVRFSWLF